MLTSFFPRIEWLAKIHLFTYKKIVTVTHTVCNEIRFSVNPISIQVNISAPLLPCPPTSASFFVLIIFRILITCRSLPSIKMLILSFSFFPKSINNSAICAALSYADLTDINKAKIKNKKRFRSARQITCYQ